MPVNQLNVGAAMVDAEQIRGMRERNALSAQARADSEALRRIGKESVIDGRYDPAMHIERLVGAGYVDQAREVLRDTLARKAQGLELLSKTLPMVTEANYGDWKRRMESMGVADPGELPAQYDAKQIGALRDAMRGLERQSFGELADVGHGFVGQRNEQTGQLANLREKPDPARGAVSYGPFEEAEGLAGGVMGQRDSTGRYVNLTQPGGKPRGSAGRQPAAVQTIEYLVASGMDRDAATAMVLRAKEQTPREFYDATLRQLRSTRRYGGREEEFHEIAKETLRQYYTPEDLAASGMPGFARDPLGIREWLDTQ